MDSISLATITLFAATFESFNSPLKISFGFGPIRSRRGLLRIFLTIRCQSLNAWFLILEAILPYRFLFSRKLSGPDFWILTPRIKFIIIIQLKGFQIRFFKVSVLVDIAGSEKLGLEVSFWFGVRLSINLWLETSLLVFAQLIILTLVRWHQISRFRQICRFFGFRKWKVVLSHHLIALKLRLVASSPC